MDPITQGLLGSACTQSLFQKKLKNLAWLVGATSAMAADLDILIRSKADPLLSIYYHRHFSHSLFFIPIGAFFVWLFWLLLLPAARKKPLVIFLACLIGYATHGFLDALTAYGTVLFWPFSLTRVHIDWLAIIDVFFTACLFLGVLFSALTNQTIYARLGLLLSILYLTFCSYFHQQALNAQKIYIRLHYPKFVTRKTRTLPVTGEPFSWRGLSLSKDKIIVTKIKTSFYHQHQIKTLIKLKHFQVSSLPKFVKSSPSLLNDFKRYRWFSDNYLAQAGSKNGTLTLIDARYILTGKHPVALWGIRFEPQNKHIIPVRYIPLSQTS